MEVTSLKNTWINQICEQYNDFEGGIDLPLNRTIEKDTKEYMLLMNSKLEYMEDTIEKNPFNSTHFAWIDFNISHVFSDLKMSKETLKIYSSSILHNSFLSIPGCWNPLSKPFNDEQVKNEILNNINWRFCGGFFIGDRISIEYFIELYKTHLPYFMFKYRKLIWEVNFWAWLELVTDWKPNWFKGDHNDSIIQIQTDYYAFSLKKIANNISSNGVANNSSPPYETIKYNYPKIHDFIPSSASYLFFEGKHYLNTRYVNYSLTPLGYYLFNHPENKIITRNFLSVLDENTMMPLNYIEITDPDPCESNLISVKCAFEGMEDIRLFNLQSSENIFNLGFIATSINYSNNGKSQMIIGNYFDKNNINSVLSTSTEHTSLTKASLYNCKIIMSPNNNHHYEKNWVPLTANKFIYKWSPFEIGVLEMTPNADFTKKNTGIEKLQIDCSIDVYSPICKKFRGSTLFVQGLNENESIGVVHYSEGNSPRHYFHCLVIINSTTFQPIKYSQPFYFENIGIEFCIGFCIKNNKYHFWISQFDRDPILIKVDIDFIPFLFKFM
jgi:hypothetical protein